MTAYYNEIDPFAAAWLRELITAGHIAPGIVDERSIEDVRPDELAGFTQCHFFAGIGVWSHALRRAGWPDDRPIWTGSCPCQPFSAAGKGEGFADERHLWPAFFHLIEQCEPAIVAGEQVASSSTGVWFDLVQADLEAMGYAFGLVPLPAAGFGGAHIRDRAFWVADANCGQRSRVAEFRGFERDGQDAGWSEGVGGIAASSIDGRVADTESLRQSGRPVRTAGWLPQNRAKEVRELGGMAHPASDGRGQGLQNGGWSNVRTLPREIILPAGALSDSDAPAPLLGRDAADWLFCRDGKWRPVGPGTFPLAHEAPARVGRLRGYGNAIDAETLTAFIGAVMAA